MSLLSYIIVGADVKQKCGGKGRKDSLALTKKTATRFTKSQHFIFITNIVITKSTAIFVVSYLNYIYCHKSFTNLLILLNVKDLIPHL